MQQLNRYYRRSRISEKKFREIIKCFSLDLTANRTAQIVGLTHKTVNQIYLKIRHRLVEDCQRQSPFSGEVEVDESYFGARRVRGKRGRGASGKTIVFGIFKRNGKVFTEIVPVVLNRRCKRSFAGMSASNQSSIPICGAAITDWLMSVIRNIFVSITALTNFQTLIQISMALKVSGRSRNDDY